MQHITWQQLFIYIGTVNPKYKYRCIWQGYHYSHNLGIHRGHGVSHICHGVHIIAGCCSSTHRGAINILMAWKPIQESPRGLKLSPSKMSFFCSGPCVNQNIANRHPNRHPEPMAKLKNYLKGTSREIANIIGQNLIKPWSYLQINGRTITDDIQIC